jgi:hypothetical protein
LFHKELPFPERSGRRDYFPELGSWRHRFFQALENSGRVFPRLGKAAPGIIFKKDFTGRGCIRIVPREQKQVTSREKQK